MKKSIQIALVFLNVVFLFSLPLSGQFVSDDAYKVWVKKMNSYTKIKGYIYVVGDSTITLMDTNNQFLKQEFSYSTIDEITFRKKVQTST